ncbi:MBL fold metallo-hydrolase [Streptomyces sp. NA02950]|uniref:MBL fold metallo-hydrolase n=1 Tax=Streptomyces sp. NA02950 TaxID=2742137 RepID=UPI00159139A4|nr:MBL fold metallo-hydrolase [Streptomyces sp. NA02950]QKV97077.1 MBL fold metallo-hydrolase [Streptomyces sp. NA02950]
MRQGPCGHGRLHELGNACYAWVAHEAGWGYSNAGLIVGESSSLLVDTLFDLNLTAAMLAEMASVTRDSPISTVVNTHANGDHYFGNQLLGHAEIIASVNAAAHMSQSDVESLRADLQAPGVHGDNVRRLFGGFDFDGITITPPTRTFEGEIRLDIGGVEVHCITVGPAHTDGDIIVYVPSARTVYAGDLLFIGATPVAWAGPISGWVKACDRILDLDVETVVPGHGPVTDKAGVQETQAYLAYVERAATECFNQGRPFEEAVAGIPLGRFGVWSEPGRLVQNVANVYQHLDPAFPRLSHIDVMKRMGDFEADFVPEES